MHFPDVLDEAGHRCLPFRIAGAVVPYVVVDPWNSVADVNVLSFLSWSRGKPEDNMGRSRIECI